MPAPFALADRHALVSGCGCADGIGFATARLLGRLGARVSITSTTERIHERAAELGGAFAAVADLADPVQARALAAAAREAHGPVDVLVNNAGMAQSGVESGGDAFAALAPDALQRQLEISFLCCGEASYVTGQTLVVDGGNVIQEHHGVDVRGGAA